jgi:hypothetical protein
MKDKVSQLKAIVLLDIRYELIFISTCIAEPAENDE